MLVDINAHSHFIRVLVPPDAAGVVFGPRYDSVPLVVE